MIPTIGFGSTPKTALESFVSSLKYLHNQSYLVEKSGKHEYFYIPTKHPRKRLYLVWLNRNGHWCCDCYTKKKEPTPWSLGYCDICNDFCGPSHTHFNDTESINLITLDP